MAPTKIQNNITDINIIMVWVVLPIELLDTGKSVVDCDTTDVGDWTVSDFVVMML